jgi:hypothetical protein
VDDPEANVPDGLLSTCKSGNALGAIPSSEVFVEAGSNGIVDSSAVAAQCGLDSICVIPAGVTFQIKHSLNLGALVVRGNVEWNDTTQVDPSAFLCAGYVAVEGEGMWDMNLQTKRAWIYVKDNGATHSHLRTRAFGTSAVSEFDNPTIDIKGRELTRTWSLLSEPIAEGEWIMKLMHNPHFLGW